MSDQNIGSELCGTPPAPPYVGERTDRAPSQSDSRPVDGRRSPMPSLTVALAVTATLFLSFESVVIVRYLLNGPVISVDTSNRDFYWWSARVVELLVLASVFGWIAYVLKERRQVGRLGTDGLLIFGMLTAGFWDPVCIWFAPAWMYSSNFVTLNDWFKHAPGVVNPDAGTMQWPVAIVLFGYPLWCVGFGVIVDLSMRHAVARWPKLPGGAILAIGYAISVVITGVAYALFKALRLMWAPGYDMGLPGHELIVMALGGAVVFWAVGVVRHFRDDNGRTIVDRPKQPWMRLLVAAGLCQLIVFVSWAPSGPLGLFSVPYPADMPKHLINNYCDLPGGPATSQYGPCPGSPGFKLPIAHR